MGSDSTLAVLKPTVKKDQTASIFVRTRQFALMSQIEG